MRRRITNAPDWWPTPHPRPTGFGDTIAKVLSAIGIKKCKGCSKRQAKLNQLFPYKK